MFTYFFSWFRKKHPRTLEYVCPPPAPESNDQLRTMTVVPYLEDLHRGEDNSEEGDEDEEYYGETFEEETLGQENDNKQSTCITSI